MPTPRLPGGPWPRRSAGSHDLDELLAGLEIVNLTEALEDPRLAAAIRRMGLDVVRGAIDRLESQTRVDELAVRPRDGDV